MFKPADYTTAADNAARNLAGNHEAVAANGGDVPQPAIVPTAIEEVAVPQGQQSAAPMNEVPNRAEAVEIGSPDEEQEAPPPSARR